MTPSTFRPTFDNVCSRYGLSSESKEIAWNACFFRWDEKKDLLNLEAVKCYEAIYRSL